MKLRELLNKANLTADGDFTDTEISDIVTDSRKADYSSMFVCISGGHSDGHKFIRRALLMGAVAIVVQNDVKVEIPPLYGEITVIRCENTRRAAAMLYNAWYGCPSDKLKIIGVTGTNGKTSVTFILKSIFEAALYKCGIIGTVECLSGVRRIDASPESPLANMTTPDPKELYRTLAFMVADGVDYVFMEVSSHALKLSKVDAIEFDTAIFTNLTPEHMDFHKDMMDYCESKSRLFRSSRRSIINADDAFCCKMINASAGKVYTYSAKGQNADFLALDVSLSDNGLRYMLKSKNAIMKLKCSLKGLFNVDNTLCAAACALLYGISPSVIDSALSSMASVKGRLERVKLPMECNFSIYIDYAHTPDALKNLLLSARGLCGESGRLTVLFGCGGDRDKEKRSVMGSIASSLADKVIITSDNSRSEDAADIIASIMTDFDRSTPHKVIEDRRTAIETAVNEAEAGEVILLSGKGHEKYEIDKWGKHPFDEYAIALEAVRKRYERHGS